MLAAVKSGFPMLEVDTRVTADGIIVVHHDPVVVGIRGEPVVLARYNWQDSGPLRPWGEDAPPLPLLDELLSVFAGSESNACLFIDVKDAGHEAQHLALLDRHRLRAKVTIVSWVPAVLTHMHELAPALPLVFGYRPLPRGASLVASALALGWKPIRFLAALAGRALRSVSLQNWSRWLLMPGTDNDLTEDLPPELAHGYLHGHLLAGLPGGRLGRCLSASGGGVVVPLRACTDALVTGAHSAGLRVCVFSVRSLAQAERVATRTGADVVFCDEAVV